MRPSYLNPDFALFSLLLLSFSRPFQRPRANSPADSAVFPLPDFFLHPSSIIKSWCEVKRRSRSRKIQWNRRFSVVFCGNSAFPIFIGRSFQPATVRRPFFGPGRLLMTVPVASLINPRWLWVLGTGIESIFVIRNLFLGLPPKILFEFAVFRFEILFCESSWECTRVKSWLLSSWWSSWSW